MRKYEVAVVKTHYYTVVADTPERAIDLAYTTDDIEPGESCEETDSFVEGSGTAKEVAHA